MESLWDWVRLEFDGGPWDGATLQWPGNLIWDGKIHEFVADNAYLYRSNGPVICLENLIQMSYVGKGVEPDGLTVVMRPPAANPGPATQREA